MLYVLSYIFQLVAVAVVVISTLISYIFSFVNYLLLIIITLHIY